MRVGLVLLALVVPLHAFADPPRCETHYHAGLDVRTDLGTHPIRAALGVRHGVLDGTLVLDPYAFLDGQHDLDALVERFFGPRVGLLAGWRWTAISVHDGLLHQQRSVVGVTGIGPTFGPIHTSASLELAILWVKHGAGTMTEWISADRNLLDHFGFGLFVRFDYVR
jgi:hypothetical protein